MKRNWKDYEGIVKGMAYKFTFTTKESVEDLIQEGYVCFIELANLEEREGLDCPFEAALSNYIKQVFISCFYLRKKAQKNTAILVDITKVDNLLGYNPVKFMDTYLSLPQEVKELANIMISTPKELISLLRKETFKKAVTVYLKEYQGWGKPRIKTLWSEIERNFVV